MKYIILTYAVIFALNPVLAKKHRKFYYAITAIMLAALAYFVVPLQEMDIYRYTNMMEYFRKKGFHWAMSEYGETNPAAVVFFYCVSLFPNNGFLPAVSVLIVYGFSLALLYKASKRLNVSNGAVNTVFLFFMLNFNYCYVIDVVKIYIAYAVLAYFLYIDLIEKRRRPLCFAVYILLCYFHYAVVLILLLRIIFLLTSKLKGAVSLITTVFIPFILLLGYKFLDNFTGDLSILTSVSDKIEDYKGYETFGVWQFLASVIRVGMFIIIGIAVPIVYNELKCLNRSKNIGINLRTASNVNQYSTFCMYITLSVITFITNYQYVLRTPYFIQILISVPVLFVLFYLKKFNRRYYSACSFLIAVESFAHFAYLLIYVYGALDFSFVM